MRVWYLLVCFVCVLTGCLHKKEEDSLHLEHTKSRMALVPLLDNSHNKFPWSVAQELSSGIYALLQKNNNLLLVDLPKIKRETDLSQIKETEFVVFTTLLEHSEKPSYSPEIMSPSDSPTNLLITLQIKVFDLRGAVPTLIAEETLKKSQHIPRQFSCFNFPQVAWGKPLYTFSPLGFAHAELIRDSAYYIENTIVAGLKNDP